MVDTRLACGGDRIGMSREPFARLQIVGGDDQDPLAARDGRTQCFGRVEIALANIHPLVPELGEFVGVARDRDDRTGARLDQLIDYLASKLAGGACDDKWSVLKACHGRIPVL